MESGTLVGLPVEVGGLVGRDAEIAAVSVLLRDAGVVTLTGVGGGGKTRLALRAARAVAGADGREVRWCDLAPVHDAAAVVHTVAHTVGAGGRAGATPVDAIVDALRSRRLLLVLDDCQHVAEVASMLLARVVDACPRVTVLATSRSRLGVAGERVRPVPPLPVGTGDGAAVALFRERARTVCPGADLRDTATIGAICRRLDGLPLAIELVAARLDALGLRQLRERLDDRGALRAVIDWSYGLLDPVERQVFDQLSVFAGGCSPTAAERVCGGAGGAVVEDALARLVDAAMVTVDDGAAERRYGMPETLRRYGADRLRLRGLADATSAAHAHCFVDVAETVGQRMGGTGEAAAVAVVERELCNLRAAHRWALATDDVDAALRIIVALRWDAFWRLRDEVFQWAEAAIELPRAYDHPLFPVACGVAAWGAGLRGQFAAARELATRGLSAAPGHDHRAVWPLCVLAHLALWWGRLDDSVRYACSAAQRSDDPHDLALALEVQVLALASAGRHEQALDAADRLQRLVDPLGNASAMALARYARGEALLDVDPKHTELLLDEAITFCATVDNRAVAEVAGAALTALRAGNEDVGDR
jgi:predicted ATPase